MKAIKTYGINGLLEWHGTLQSHGIKMKVDFTNGSVTAYGVAPATFTTKDELTQHIIENSEMFKKGRIKVIKSVMLPEEQPKQQPKPAAMAPKPEPTGDAKPAAAVTEEEAGEPAAADGGNVVKVSDKSEAIEWLKEHFPEEGYTAVKLRTMAAVIEAGKKHGVVFDVAE